MIEGTYQTSPDRARADRDHRLHRQARGRRADHRPHQHAGSVLLARQHGDHPPDRAVAAALHRRHGGRRVRRQGRRHHRADRVPGGAQDRPAGPLRLHARGGDARVVDAVRQPDPHRRRRDGRRADRLARGDLVPRRRRLLAATRRTAPPSTRPTRPAVHDPQRVDRRALRATNRQPSSAFRRFGVTEASFATEMQMDRIARDRGRPVELPIEERAGTATSGRIARSSRTRRWSRPSAPPPSSWGTSSHEALRTRHRRRQLPDRHEPGRRPDQALVHATTVGNFVITLSSVDLGQGLKTVLAQIGARRWASRSRPCADTGDTDTGPHCMGTFASRRHPRRQRDRARGWTRPSACCSRSPAEEMEASPEDLRPTARATCA